MVHEQSFLFETLDVAREKFGVVHEVPKHIRENLNPKIVLRPYQISALSNTLEYLTNSELSKSRQTHLLYHMATGSGKTVMMAALILEFYKRGYRNFLFFVNQTNIIEKTRANFLDKASTKYLFNDVIQIDGKAVVVNEVDNFSGSNKEAINLCFTTTQQLHSDYFDPKENSLSQDDFEDAPVVLISDESHHVNTRTKNKSKAEAEADRSWEYTVSNAFSGHRENVLLEFTATVDLRDKNILQKYRNKIVFDYSLAKFRESGYTKDFQNYQSDEGPWHRTLVALILSEYRRNLFADIGIFCKPVVLLKSNRISDSKKFYEEFFEYLAYLSPDEIRQVMSGRLIEEAISYFEAKDASLGGLIQALQQEFSRENSIIMNEKSDNNVSKQFAVNSLEDRNNQFRIIFTVEMLNEGWDVLNLFDIVRLYETRQGGKAGKPSNYTIKEAQLIGRGARYFPFVPANVEISSAADLAFKRKYDSDLDNPFRLLETMLFHSKQDSKYINELRAALKETGLLPDESFEVVYKLKSEFKQSDFFHNALVFVNKRIENSKSDVRGLDHRIRNRSFEVIAGRRRDTVSELFGEVNEAEQTRSFFQVKTLRISELPENVVFGTLARDRRFAFSRLQHLFPELSSMRQFAYGTEYLGAIELSFKMYSGQITAVEMSNGLTEVLESVNQSLEKIDVNAKGSYEFYPVALSSVLRDKRMMLSKIVEGGLGSSQINLSDPSQAVDLAGADWYVYNDNYGTREEKAFVKYFSGIEAELREKYSEIYLIRNERIPEFAIYSFETGERFEPDFLLFLRQSSASGFDVQQVFVEPKGSHLLQADSWKEEFLLELEEAALPIKTYVDNNEYRIIGMPFYNEEFRSEEFREAVTANWFTD